MNPAAPLMRQAAIALQQAPSLEKVAPTSTSDQAKPTLAGKCLSQLRMDFSHVSEGSAARRSYCAGQQEAVAGMRAPRLSIQFPLPVDGAARAARVIQGRPLLAVEAPMHADICSHQRVAHRTEGPHHKIADGLQGAHYN